MLKMRLAPWVTAPAVEEVEAGAGAEVGVNVVLDGTKEETATEVKMEMTEVGRLDDQSVVEAAKVEAEKDDVVATVAVLENTKGTNVVVGVGVDVAVELVDDELLDELNELSDELEAEEGPFEKLGMEKELELGVEEEDGVEVGEGVDDGEAELLGGGLDIPDPPARTPRAQAAASPANTSM